jgi:predicted alpha/beta superfamily hydrolase
MAKAKTPAGLGKGRPAVLPFTSEFDVASKISGRSYRVFVFQPLVPPPEGGYPVVYFTDGNLSFPIAMAMAASFQLSGKPVLAVGVGYANPLELFQLRTRDLTPPTPLANIRAQPGLPPPTAENYGGADEFRRFLVEELRPAIAAAYPASADDQTLFGYSLGGLFVLHVLFNHPTSFRTFATASPSIWWNKRAVLRDEKRLTAAVSGKTAAPRVLITVGADEQKTPTEAPPGMTPAETRKLMREARMVDNAGELAARLAGLKGGRGYDTQFQAFEREDHLTSMAAAISRALAFALRP